MLRPRRLFTRGEAKGTSVRQQCDAPTRHVTLALHTAESRKQWAEAGGARSARLLLSRREAGALNRNYVNPKVWKPALVAAGIEETRENGMHALRHLYASVLLDGGESIRALAQYLGHTDPGFTLRTYTHPMPTSDQRTKKAVDAALGFPGTSVDGLSSDPPGAHGPPGEGVTEGQRGDVLRCRSRGAKPL